LVYIHEEVAAMTLVKWEPFRDLMAMQDRMTHLFDETLSRIWKEEGVARGVWSPPVDISEKESEIVLKIDLPEMNQAEIDIKVEENTLIIQGERKLLKEGDETFIQIERPYGTFQRSFNIPRRVDPEKIKAAYKNGVLRVILPKRGETYAKQVSVEVK
jgi:HSP20 family protein